MHRQPLGQQISRWFVTGFVGQREQLACGAGHGFMAGDQNAHHLQRLGRHARCIGHRGQLAKLRIRARCGVSERANAFGNRVHRGPQLGVLHHEHLVQGVEHGAGNVPVKVVRGQVQRVGVGQQMRQAFGD